MSALSYDGQGALFKLVNYVFTFTMRGGGEGDSFKRRIKSLGSGQDFKDWF